MLDAHLVVDKGGGMELFEGGAKEEDFVEFRIFLRAGVSLIEAEERIMRLVERLCRNYVWHRDAFALSIHSEGGSLRSSHRRKKDPLEGAAPHLCHRMFVGDCVEDEWFVVFLLLQISEDTDLQSLCDPIITVHDNDGEFLLIEAAFHLPKWISKPKHSINRVFLSKGQLLLLPRCISINDPSSFTTEQGPAFFGDSSSFPSIAEALACAREGRHTMRAPDLVEKTAFARTLKYREALAQMEKGEIGSLQEQHFAAVCVAEPLARLLEDSVVLSEAIQWVYHPDWLMDPIKRRHTPSTPRSRLLDMYGEQKEPIWVRVRFSRWLFAQVSFFQLPGGDQNSSIKPEQCLTPEAKGIELGNKLSFCLSALYDRVVKEEDTRSSSLLHRFACVDQSSLEAHTRER